MSFICDCGRSLSHKKLLNRHLKTKIHKKLMEEKVEELNEEVKEETTRDIYMPLQDFYNYFEDHLPKYLVKKIKKDFRFNDEEDASEGICITMYSLTKKDCEEYNITPNSSFCLLKYQITEYDKRVYRYIRYNNSSYFALFLSNFTFDEDEDEDEDEE